MMAPVPDFPPMLINEVGANNLCGVGDLQRLLGTWISPSGARAQGYNVMPLPQRGELITKNFLYYEEMSFTSPGIAPNRGDMGVQQACAALTYEQRVYFAEGPAANMLVHFENGLWLNTTFAVQRDGAYIPVVPGSAPVPPEYMYPLVKQVSVPHGNSILAVGAVSPFRGQPDIPVPSLTMPPFGPANIPNPNMALVDRNNNLLRAGAMFGPDGVHLHVSSNNGPGAGIRNIAFEQRHVKVTSYEMDIWLVSVNVDRATQTQLQYTQTIAMDIVQSPNSPPIPTLHVTANSLMQKPYILSANLEAAKYPVNLPQ